ncbi:hypothetical protein ASD14_09875 [Lysobacter sp. Root494]|nr:hypothetical protein ASD14_09875 [Lysobacter sp. Root494]
MACENHVVTKRAVRFSGEIDSLFVLDVAQPRSLPNIVFPVLSFVATAEGEYIVVIAICIKSRPKTGMRIFQI